MSDLENIKRGRLTADELAQLDALADQGLKPAHVARRLNRHPATIAWQFIVRGHKEFKPRAAIPGSYKRGDVTVVRFTPEEDAYIEALRVQGIKCAEICGFVSKRFGHQRSPHTILMRLKMLACAEAA